MSFDYIRAFHEVAAPAFEALPADVRRLLDRVTAECHDLNQLPDLSMPWPDKDVSASSLREAFDSIPAEWLAQASRVVYFAGHWHPALKDANGRPVRLVPADGSTWKFAHYADQSLRGRLGLPEAGDRDKGTIQTKVIEGAIRVCYSSDDLWTWKEIAPATAEGYRFAQTITAQLADRIATVPGPMIRTAREKRDAIAYEFLQSVEAKNPLRTFAGWEPWTNVAERYQEAYS